VEEIKQLLERYPYLTYLTYGGNDYVGIVQNVDDIITTIYDYSILRTAEEKARFLELGDVWWWESNRGIPINLFLKQDWTPFKAVLRTMNSKDVEIKLGPYVSLKEMSAKRSKRRSITLIRKLS
jgi:pyridoxine 5'-phosphate synthase PdxJ